MKIQLLLLSICSIFLFATCQSNSENNNQDTSNTDEPAIMEWLDLKGAEGAKNIVLISGDEEYRSEEALPQLGKILAQHHGFNCKVLFAQNPENPGIVDPNYLHNIPGLEALEEADLMIIQTRFRALPDEQMEYIDAFLKSGKPVFGIRTATHAFNFKDSTSNWLHYGNYYKEDDAWKGGFGRLVLGERWHTHHGHHKHQSTRGVFAEFGTDHPIRKGIKSDSNWGSTDVYGVRLPMPGDSYPVIYGHVINRAGEYDEADLNYGMRPTDTEVAKINPARKDAGDPNAPMMPIAWTKSYQLPDGKEGKSFTSTIGSSSDIENEPLRRLFVNAVYYLLEQEIPEKAKVDIVGNYQPTAYAFRSDEYWKEKNIKISDLVTRKQ